MNTKLCVDCRHNMDESFCNNPASTNMDLVSGKRAWVYALTERSDRGRCGPDGKYFEAYPPRKSFLAWMLGR